MEIFENQKELYNDTMTKLSQAVAILRKEGKDFSDLLKQAQALIAPEQPEYPDYYKSPPVPPQIGFKVNLPEGEYALRFITNNGNIMEGSERKIISFKNQRYQSAGLDIIPGDKWTRPVSSKTPSAIIYIDGSSDIYLRSFYQEEYNDLYYNKLIKNDAKGNPDLSKWIQIQQIPHAQIKLTNTNGDNTIIDESPFFIEQIPGSSLGYEIVEFEPEGKHKGQNPGLQAFHIPIDTNIRSLNLEVLDSNGDVLPGAYRQIRIIQKTGSRFIALIFALLPLIILILVKRKRAKFYK